MSTNHLGGGSPSKILAIFHSEGDHFRPPSCYAAFETDRRAGPRAVRPVIDVLQILHVEVGEAREGVGRCGSVATSRICRVGFEFHSTRKDLRKLRSQLFSVTVLAGLCGPKILAFLIHSSLCHLADPTVKLFRRGCAGEPVRKTLAKLQPLPSCSH